MQWVSHSDHPNSVLTAGGCGRPPWHSGVLTGGLGAPRTFQGRQKRQRLPVPGSGCEGMWGMGQPVKHSRDESKQPVSGSRV